LENVLTALALDVRAMPMYHAAKKRSQVETIIAATASSHAITDAAFNLAGFLPIPGAGLIGAAASIAAQAPLFYQPMVRKIAATYMRPVDAEMADLTTDAAWLGAEFDIAAFFGAEFIGGLVQEIIVEAGAGYALAKFIPFVGPFLSGGMDAVIASTLTWRVGVTAVLFYENGLSWPGGDQKATYQTAKDVGGGFTQTEKRVDLNTLRSKVPEINKTSVRTTMELVKMLRGFSIPVDQIRRKLKEENGIDTDIVEAALRDLRL
jgi:hypothetical protein